MASPDDRWLRRGSALAREVIGVFRDRDLLVETGALALRALLALIPVLLFTVGLLGFLGLEEVWRQDIAPDLKQSIGTTSFKFIDQAVIKVLSSKQLFWVTLGAVLAVWESSAIVRAGGKVLNRIYEVGEQRPAAREILVSLPLGALGIVLVLAAAAVVRLGAIAFDDLLGSGLLAELSSFAVRWSIAAGLMLALVATMLRLAPEVERPPRSVGLGAALTVLAWALATLAFGFYLQTIASYSSFFGNLATVFVLVEYLYLVSFVFLGGVVVEVILTREGRA